MRASSPSVAAETSRRFWWRFFGQGSGNRIKARPMLASRQPAQQRAGVVGVEPDVGELLLGDGAQNLDDPVLERLAADEAHAAVVPGLPEEVLAAAETDLEPDLLDGRREEGFQMRRRRLRRVEREARQRALPQRGLPGARRPSTSSPVAAQLVLAIVALCLVSIVRPMGVSTPFDDRRSRPRR